MGYESERRGQLNEKLRGTESTSGKIKNPEKMGKCERTDKN